MRLSIASNLQWTISTFAYSMRDTPTSISPTSLALAMMCWLSWVELARHCSSVLNCSAYYYESKLSSFSTSGSSKFDSRNRFYRLIKSDSSEGSLSSDIFRLLAFPGLRLGIESIEAVGS